MSRLASRYYVVSALSLAVLTPVAIGLLRGDHVQLPRAEAAAPTLPNVKIGDLTWTGSIEKAQKQAQKENKPIVLVNVFGRWDEDLCCTNARTLRATLFTDKDVQARLKEKAVIAWTSVAPVPKVTIDLGNGKTIKRTVGGNAVICFVLPDGRVMDALAGLYTPKDFLTEFNKALDQIDKLGGAKVAMTKPMEIAKWQREEAANAVITERMATTFTKAFVESPVLRMALSREPLPQGIRVKSRVPVLTPPSPEQPTLQGQQVQVASIGQGGFGNSTRGFRGGRGENDPFLKEADKLTAESKFETVAARLNDLSRSSLTTEDVQKATGVTAPSPEQLGKLVIALDSQNNMKLVHPVSRLYFASCDKQLPTIEECRNTMYEKVLHIPLGDPYLGLHDILVPGTPY